jgi:hypothetical protein
MPNPIYLCSFLLPQKRTKKGAPKTKTAVFGWFFEELLCKEVKGSGAGVGALAVAAVIRNSTPFDQNYVYQPEFGKPIENTTLTPCNPLPAPLPQSFGSSIVAKNFLRPAASPRAAPVAHT